MAQIPDQDHYQMITKLMVQGAVVPFLGAGVNLCGRPATTAWQRGTDLPSGTELAGYLADSFDYPFADKSDLLRVSQYVDVQLGGGPLYEALHEIFDADYVPSPLHRLLAGVPAAVRAAGSTRFPLIVTTNYDDALERAFREADEPFDLVTYIADGPDRGKFRHTMPDGTSQLIAVPNKYDLLRFDKHAVIAKIHGAVSRSPDDLDSFVITENHYIAYLSRTDVANLIPVTIAARMRRSHFLFLGYSLHDWNLRVILHRLWGDDGLSYNSWAIQASPDRIEEKAWYRRGVELLDVELATYAAEVGSRLPAGQPTGSLS